jgi:UDP-N-acetylmuramoylalanine--D-glutamate ligase
VTAVVEASPPEPLAIVGLGVSGRATARHLIGRGLRPVGFDERAVDDADAELAALRAAGLTVRAGPGAVAGLDAFATVFVTPGMRKDHPALRAAARAGSVVTGEIPYTLARATARTAGITGSAGKTTTTTLVAEMARVGGVDAFVGGNLGRPAIEALDLAPPPAWLVLELSSFQLDLCRVSPRVAALLNLAPNHLDVHRDMDDYRRAKLNILRHQGEGDSAVTSADRPVDGAFAVGRPSRRLLFGLEPTAVDEGATLVGDRLVLRDGERETFLVERAAVAVPGRHNLENVLAAATIAHLIGVAPEAIAAAIRAFRGVPHRLELVHEAAGVRYVDDSIATAPDRTIAALEAIAGPVVLIAGGSDKGLDYAPLGPALRARVRVLLTMGPTGPAIARASARAGGPTAIACADLADAVAQARARARPGDTVLLAPAAASFDQFPNYAARGDAFRRLVRAEAGPADGGGRGG